MSEPVEFDVEFDPPPPARTPPPAPRRAETHPADEEYHPPAKISPPRRDSYSRNGTTRELPHSHEAEEYLLSCCFLDGETVIARCIEVRIRPDSFYDSKHGLIYECLVDLHHRRVAIDISVVAEELKAARKLEQIGGYPTLVQITQRIPTQAQAGYFIDKVREQSLLREIFRSAAGAVEDCYNFTGGIDEFLAEQQARLKHITESSTGHAQEQVVARAFDLGRQIEKPTPVYTLAGTTISTPGNLMAIYSQAKTGKSALVGAMIGAAMTTPTSGHDTLNISGPNYANHALLHFDTEQSPYDWQQLIKSTLRRVGLAAPPPWVMSYTLAGLSAPDCRDFIEASLKRARRLHGGIHSVIIDGVADLVIDPNDPEECFPLITRLQGAAIEFNTGIACILHLNPGAEATSKGRGHLGSQLERKAESNLTLEKNGDEITKVWATKQRGKAITKDRAIAFSWSDEHQMHRSCANPDAPAKKTGRIPKYEFATFRVIMPLATDRHKPLAELYRLAGQVSDIPRNTFRDLMARELEIGTIDQFMDPSRGVSFRLRAAP